MLCDRTEHVPRHLGQGGLELLSGLLRAGGRDDAVALADGDAAEFVLEERGELGGAAREDSESVGERVDTGVAEGIEEDEIHEEGEEEGGEDERDFGGAEVAECGAEDEDTHEPAGAGVGRAGRLARAARP